MKLKWTENRALACIVLAVAVLKEEITLLRVAGILCVMAGVLLICGGDSGEAQDK